MGGKFRAYAHQSVIENGANAYCTKMAAASASRLSPASSAITCGVCVAVGCGVGGCVHSSMRTGLTGEVVCLHGPLSVRESRTMTLFAVGVQVTIIATSTAAGWRTRPDERRAMPVAAPNAGITTILAAVRVPSARHETSVAAIPWRGRVCA